MCDFLPPSLAAWVEDEADRLDVAPSSIAAAALVGLAAVVGRSHVICPKALDSWRVVPVLWGGIVGGPGKRKTASLRAGLAPVEAIERRERDDFEAEGPRRRAQLASAETKVAALREALRRAQKPGSSDADEVERLELQLAEAIREQERLEEGSSAGRLTTSDATIEKLAELLRRNPRGMLVVRDELAGFIGSLDRADRPADRPFYLEGWNGSGSFEVDRVGRGSIYVPALCLSIFGGLQPDRLRPIVEAAASTGGDGLLARFQLLIYPDDRGAEVYQDRAPNVAARNEAFEAYVRLNAAALRAIDSGEPRVLRFDPESQALFIEAWQELAVELDTEAAKALPAWESHLAKFSRLLPAIALLLELVERPDAQTVGAGAALRALRWRDLLRGHAEKVYAPVLRSEVAAAHALLSKVRAGAIEDGSTVRSVYRNQWAGLRTPESVGAGLAQLEQHGWLWIEELGDAGRPRRVLRISPAVREGRS